MLVPRQTAPDLNVDTLDHGRFDLATEKPERFTLVCFYRGFHCPLCATYLKQLEQLTPAFSERGVAVLALSSDTKERARAMADKIDVAALRIGFGLSLDKAREWGLYISASRGETSVGVMEPALFSEPGVFLIRPDRSVYYVSVQSMPFARPDFNALLQALDFVIRNDYPARGEHTGPV